MPSLASVPTVDAVTESSVSSWGAAAIWGVLVFIGTDSPVHCGKVCLQPVDDGSTPVPLQYRLGEGTLVQADHGGLTVPSA